MHTSISQRRAILEELRERARLATAEFYRKPNTIVPALAPRFIVKSSGNNISEVIKRTTGKIITERFGHNKAIEHVRVLEEQAKQPSAKRFGRILHNRNLRINITLTLPVLL